MTNDSIIKETLEDGTEYQFDTDVCWDLAEGVLEDLYSLEGNEPNFDYTCSLYYLFVMSVGILSNSGWTTRDLLKEVVNHSEADDVEEFKNIFEKTLDKPEEVA